MRSKINLSFTEAAKEIPQLARYLSVEPLRDFTGKIIDPWDESELTKCDKDDIIRKCCEDIWYFLKYVVKVRGQNNTILDFHLNAASAAFIYLFQHNQNAILLGMRQSTQKTALLDALYLWSALFDSFNPLHISLMGYGKGLCVTVPEFICTKRTLSDVNEDFDRITNRDKCFIDELMYIPKEYFQQLDVPYYDVPYYAVGTIGPYHADTVQKTILFDERMYYQNLETFERIFTEYTGYRPSYLILMGIDDIDDPCVDKWKKQFPNDTDDRRELYRKEIEIKPDWKM